MSYTPTTWVDGPTGGTPITATELNRIEAGVVDAVGKADTATQPADLSAAVTAAVNGLLNGAPGALDTLKELADALNDDATFGADMLTSIAAKQPLSSNLTAFAGKTAPTGTVLGTTDVQALTHKDLTDPTNIFPAGGLYFDEGAAVFNAKGLAYGAKGDGIVTTGAMTSGSAALTPTGTTFVPADVGKVIVVQGAGTQRSTADGAVNVSTNALQLTSATAAFTAADVRSQISIVGAGAAGATLVTTIVEVNNSTTVTLAVAASTTVSGASISISAFLKTTIASVSGGNATLAATAGNTVTGANVLYGTSDTAAIQAAINAAAVSGGTVLIPPGKYLTTAQLTVANNVAVRGAGEGNTVLYMASLTVMAAFYGIYSSGSPLTKFAATDFTVDGAFTQPTTNVGNNVGNKGFFFQYCSACAFQDLTIRNTLATGLGTDFLTNGTTIRNVNTFNCGAQSWNTSQGGGCAGIGIGTGQHTTEEFTISGCHASGNGTYGIFIETQTGTCSQGIRVIGCSAEGNHISGFADAGGAGGIWSGCWSYNNSLDGFDSDAGTVGTGVAGNDTIWADCVAWGNGQYGFYYNAFQPNSICRVSWKGCKAIANHNQGFYVNTQSSGTTLDGLQYDACEAYLNGSSGWIVAGPGAVKNVIVNGGSFHENGQISGSDHYGLRINCTATNVNIRGAKCYDDGGTQKQTHGLALSSGFTITGLIVEGNDFQGNLTGAISMGATLGGSLRLRNNAGYNPVGSSVPGTAFALAATTVAWANTTGVDVELYCTAAGTVTAVAISGVTVCSTALTVGQRFRVPANGTFTVTYTGAPTFAVVGE